MAQDIIEVQMPKVDNTQSIAAMVVTKQAVTAANGIKINNITGNKNNSLYIIVENTGTASTITLKKGDMYPNKALGDLALAVEAGINAIQLQDPSRFECRDTSLNIEFASEFKGNIYAIAKRAGLLPVETE